MSDFKDYRNLISSKEKKSKKLKKLKIKKNGYNLNSFFSFIFKFINIFFICFFLLVSYFWYKTKYNKNTFFLVKESSLDLKTPLVENKNNSFENLLNQFITNPIKNNSIVKNENPFNSNSIFKKIIDPLKKNEPRWKYIIIHHSGIDKGNKEIYHQYHMNKYNRPLLYHFIIGNGSHSLDGEIEIGKHWENQSEGGHINIKKNIKNDIYNQKGIGICLVGNFNLKKPSTKQLESLKNLSLFLIKQFSIPLKNILIHQEINKTSCPGEFFLKENFLNQIKSALY